MKIEYEPGHGAWATRENWQTVVRTYLRDYKTTARTVAAELGLPYGAVRELLVAARETELYLDLCEQLETESELAAKNRKCGARCRTGKPCKAPGKWNGGKCRMHGGWSTGPTSPEGKERARQAVVRRWGRYRAEKQASNSP